MAKFSKALDTMTNEHIQKTFGSNRATLMYWLGDTEDVRMTADELAAARARIAARKAARL